SGNNVRAPGGIVYGPNRETNIDIRGDVQTPPTVADLLLGVTAAGTSTSTNVWTQSSKLLRVGDVANVAFGYETQRVFAYTRGKPTIELDVQKASNTSEVTASQQVLNALPALRSQYPDVQ